MAGDIHTDRAREHEQSSVKMPQPEARQNPNLMDIQEGSERMQGEPEGRQAPNPREKEREQRD
jgi:hypothetical protein